MNAFRRRLAAALVCALAVAGCSSADDSGAQPQPVGTTPGSAGATTPVPGPTGQPGEAPSDTPTGSASPSPVQATTKAAPRSFTVVMSGDVLLHSGLWETAANDAQRTGRGSMDYRPMLADMRPVIAGADLAICHLETPLAPKGGPFASYPVFSVPPAIAPALKWEGYDACTTASNHTLDQGFTGLVRTLDDLEAAGIAHAGSAATRADSRQPLMLDVKGVKVALISATYGTNGIPIPSAEPWSVPLIDVGAIEQRAARARAEGANVVIVAPALGARVRPRADLRPGVGRQGADGRR